MLLELHISNYALIDELHIQFFKGFNIITGETGAGKSIVLGALGLVMGQRADLNVLRDKERKCTVESIFNIQDYRLQAFFEREELDYDDQTILRREISPAGKSRAFINDTPVTLKVLQELAVCLIDIHSQHQNMQLGNQSFQMNLVDLVAENSLLLEEYGQSFRASQKQTQLLKNLQEEAGKAKADLDYFQFQFQQLDDARLKSGEQDELEAEQATLEHAEDIKTTFGQFATDMDGDEGALLVRLKEHISQFAKLADVLPKASELTERLESCYLELKDLVGDSTDVAESTEHDSARIQFVADRLDTLYTLQQKFRVDSVDELLQLKDEYDQKISQIGSFDEEIEAAASRLNELKARVDEQAAELSTRRRAVAAKISQMVEQGLQKLGMENAVFRLKFDDLKQPGPWGTDDLSFTFSANKNAPLQDIARIASGGEISRVMLALKALVASSKSLPTIIFDEIDTGISGEVALKMGAILKEMSTDVQIINITHLPQIAGKGEHHFKVYKYDEADRTYTSIRQLGVDERIDELAQMLSGANASETARKTARELLD
ncbi:DNA repair protein RecN [Mangrovibacterium marinum]|uniref:DNA repair protein RecN n=1 Tax=Mangrovibacterium marinum TaxID=1639118 RepID=A0A2T5C569_9BACT|nr:DNA repair protein RecN [Mangrovibacterium marinum]PTN10043.1 DNA replication and repair protein RecN [Mangrovibacterium marinum]